MQYPSGNRVYVPSSSWQIGQQPSHPVYTTTTTSSYPSHIGGSQIIRTDNSIPPQEYYRNSVGTASTSYEQNRSSYPPHNAGPVQVTYYPATASVHQPERNYVGGANQYSTYQPIQIIGSSVTYSTPEIRQVPSTIYYSQSQPRYTIDDQYRQTGLKTIPEIAEAELYASNPMFLDQDQGPPEISEIRPISGSSNLDTDYFHDDQHAEEIKLMNLNKYDSNREDPHPEHKVGFSSQKGLNLNLNTIHLGRQSQTHSIIKSRRGTMSPKKMTGFNDIYKDVDLKKFKKSDFEFGPKIGKGKYGDVFLAREHKTNWIVALKVLDKMMIRQMRAQRQVVREIKYHSFLKHENVIKLYGVFHDDDKIYMILEYAADGEVYKELKNSPGKKFTEEKAAKYIKQVLDAIMYIHSHDIIHRDLKPENLLNSYGTLKLADFGWSVYAPESKNRRNTFCGTLDYMPPEMVQCEKYDYHSDNWSIGIMAFEFLTGSVPFGQRTEAETLDCIVKSELVIPDYVSDEAKSFIDGLLNPEPKKRMELTEAIEHPWIKRYN